MGTPLTASRAQLALACGYPFRADVEARPVVQGEAARRGTEAHEHLARMALAAELGGILAEASIAPGNACVYVERGFACVGSVAVWGPQRGQDGYGQTPDAWHTGTLDLAWADEHGRLHIRDWKTGRRDNVTPARDNAQLAITAWALSRILGQRVGTVGLWFVDYQPDAETPISWRGEDVYEPDDLDLDAVATILRRRHADALASIGDPTPGPHCGALYCPERDRCPAVMTHVTHVVGEHATGLATTSDMARVARMLPMVRAYADAAEERLKQYVLEHGPIDIGDGYVYDVTRQIRRSVRWTHEVRALLEDMGQTRAISHRVNVSDLSQPALDALAARGLVTTTETIVARTRRST
jgi:hypothetical protein